MKKMDVSTKRLHFLRKEPIISSKSFLFEPVEILSWPHRVDISKKQGTSSHQLNDILICVEVFVRWRLRSAIYSMTDIWKIFQNRARLWDEIKWIACLFLALNLPTKFLILNANIILVNFKQFKILRGNLICFQILSVLVNQCNNINCTRRTYGSPIITCFIHVT